VALLELPLAVFECLVRHLSVFDICVLGKVNPMLETRCWEAIGERKDKVRKETTLNVKEVGVLKMCFICQLDRVWMDSAFDSIREDLRTKIVSSFDNMVGRSRRKDLGVWIPEEDPMEQATYRDVCNAVINFWDIVREGELVIDPMTDFEIATKEALLDKRSNKLTTEDCNRITGTAGCMLYNFWGCRDDDENLSQSMVS
jgi:aromatic ring-cleaving dioxygenase